MLHANTVLYMKVRHHNGLNVHIYYLFRILNICKRALALLLIFNLGNDSSESDGSTHPWQTRLLHSTCILKRHFHVNTVCVFVCVWEGGAIISDRLEKDKKVGVGYGDKQTQSYERAPVRNEGKKIEQVEKHKSSSQKKWKNNHR